MWNLDVLNRIKDIMDQMGWTEYKLAKESNLSQSTISNMFARNTLPTIPTLEAICKAFRISLSEFFLDDADSTKSTVMSKYTRLNNEQQELVVKLMDNMK